MALETRRVSDPDASTSDSTATSPIAHRRRTRPHDPQRRKEELQRASAAAVDSVAGKQVDVRAQAPVDGSALANTSPHVAAAPRTATRAVPPAAPSATSSLPKSSNHLRDRRQSTGKQASPLDTQKVLAPEEFDSLLSFGLSILSSTELSSPSSKSTPLAATMAAIAHKRAVDQPGADAIEPENIGVPNIGIAVANYASAIGADLTAALEQLRARESEVPPSLEAGAAVNGGGLDAHNGRSEETEDAVMNDTSDTRTVVGDGAVVPTSGVKRSASDAADDDASTSPNRPNKRSRWGSPLRSDSSSSVPAPAAPSTTSSASSTTLVDPPASSVLSSPSKKPPTMPMAMRRTHSGLSSISRTTSGSDSHALSPVIPASAQERSDARSPLPAPPRLPRALAPLAARTAPSKSPAPTSAPETAPDPDHDKPLDAAGDETATEDVLAERRARYRQWQKGRDSPVPPVQPLPRDMGARSRSPTPVPQLNGRRTATVTAPASANVSRSPPLDASAPASAEVHQPEIEHPRLPVPGLWGIKVGGNRPAVFDIEFFVHDDVATGVERWAKRHSHFNPEDAHFALHLLPLNKVQVANLHAELTADATREEIASAMWALDRRWPARGALLVEINPGAKEKKQCWLPNQGVLNPNSPALDLSAFVRRGANTLRLVQIGDASEIVFFLHAAPPSGAEREAARCRTLALHADRKRVEGKTAAMFATRGPRPANKEAVSPVGS